MNYMMQMDFFALSFFGACFGHIDTLVQLWVWGEEPPHVQEYKQRNSVGKKGKREKAHEKM